MKLQSLLMGICLSTGILLQAGSAQAMGPHAPLTTASHVELENYAGKWYEVARLPNWFEIGCVGVTANYTARADGRIDVKNTCHRESCGSTPKDVTGIARVVDPATNSKLKVDFFPALGGLAEGDYWILEVDPEYKVYAVVGSPDRSYFWILSRTPTLPAALISEIQSRYQAQGFNLDKKLHKTAACE